MELLEHSSDSSEVNRCVDRDSDSGGDVIGGDSGNNNSNNNNNNNNSSNKWSIARCNPNPNIHMNMNLIDIHTNLIIEIVGFLVLIAAAVCEYIYKLDVIVDFELLVSEYGWAVGGGSYVLQYIPDAVRFRYVYGWGCMYVCDCMF